MKNLSSTIAVLLVLAAPLPAIAYTEKDKKFDPGNSKAAIMLDNNNKKISVPALLNSKSFIVTDEGSAF